MTHTHTLTHTRTHMFDMQRVPGDPRTQLYQTATDESLYPPHALTLSISPPVLFLEIGPFVGGYSHTEWFSARMVHVVNWVRLHESILVIDKILNNANLSRLVDQWFVTEHSRHEDRH